MVIVLLCSGIIAGTFAGIAFWIAGYGIGMIALAYWATGSTAVIVTVLTQVLFSPFIFRRSRLHASEGDEYVSRKAAS
ncbi:hypothetical protein [Paracoccus sp. PAMC 22219]|uniref:hypothetical protein n=1 Tax=Paracoccus sp. PAMC 22219 TaxID=1569209 RepID=UPI0012DFE9D4|nr:hypothetical protein [Paracoccus sp. PAMC 22219]